MCEILEKKPSFTFEEEEEELAVMMPEEASKKESNNMLSLSQFEFDFCFVPESNERLSGLKRKDFDVHWRVNWKLLRDVGLKVSVRELLTQRYNKPQPIGNDYYDYNDWFKLVVTDAYIFRELCLEFHSTYCLKEEPERMNDRDFMRFRLGGKDRRMSLAEFTGCLNIYSPKQMDEQHFSDYIWSGARVSDIMNEEAFDPNSVWKEFGSSSSSSWPPRDGNKFPSTIDLDDINCRLLHMFLTLSIFHRAEDTDKVYLSDLWYLKQIRSKDTYVNIPYCVAYYLRHFAANNNPICGGHFVTLIADHFGIKRDESARFIKYPRCTISHVECMNANVIYLWRTGIFLYDPALKPPPPLPELEEEEEEEEEQQRLPVPENIMASLLSQKELTLEFPKGLSDDKLAKLREYLIKLSPECIVSV